MKGSRFTQEQIIRILKEQEGGAKTADVCRKHGLSEATFYKWKAKFGGLEVSDTRRLRALEEENAKLKKLLAEAMLDNAMLPEDAGTNKSFNGRLRDECLNETLFTSMAHARAELADWKEDYNSVRPHSAIGYLTPAVYAKLSDPGMQRDGTLLKMQVST